MKRITLLLVALILNLSCFAQNADRGIRFTNVKISRVGADVMVTFRVEVGQNAAKGDNSRTITPVMSNKNDIVKFKPILIQGKRAKVSTDRRKIASRITSDDRDMFITAVNGQSFDYNARLPYQKWIEGADFHAESVSRDCCSESTPIIEVLASNLAFTQQVATQPALQIVLVKPEVQPHAKPENTGGSTADLLAQQYSFLVKDKPIDPSQFNYNMPLSTGRGASLDQQNDLEKYLDENRDGSLTLYFPQAVSVLDRRFRNNNETLVELISVIRKIESSGDSRISRIVIAGFASPEGLAIHNERLAWDRATALKSFILNNSTISNRTINIFNGSADWRGLRKMVEESDMYDKYEILTIIDYTPIWDSRAQEGRLGKLMRLRGGDSYRFMLKYFFPDLRNATYIRIYYENN